MCWVVFFGCSGDKAPEKKLIRPVRYATVKTVKGISTRVFPGVSKSGTEAVLSFRVGGALKQIDAKVGARVTKGTLLAVLDDTDEQLKFEEAQAAFNNAKIQLENSETNLNRIRKLYENNTTSLNDYERAKAQHSNATADFRSKRKRVDLQKSQLYYTFLRAPMDGIISDVFVEKNENIGPGQKIISLDAGDDLELKVGLPEAYISNVKSGDSVDIQFTSIPEKVFKGRISEVSFTNYSGSVYPVKIKLINSDKTIRPGMPAERLPNVRATLDRQKAFPPSTWGDVYGPCGRSYW